MMEKTYRKHIYLIALVLAFAVGTASAQQQPPQAGFGPQGQGQDAPYLRLIDELGLDEYQAAQIQATFEEARALHDEERAICYANNEAIKADTHALVMSMLNEDQQARFEELNQLREERWGGEDRGNKGQRGQGADRPNGDGDCTNPECTSDECPNPDCTNDGPMGNEAPRNGAPGGAG